MWISDRDICPAMERAVLAENVPYAVLNLMSDDPGMRWVIDETRRLIGYQPTDSHVAIVSEDQMKTEALAHQADIATEMLQEGFAGLDR
jgi:NAD+ dependent glucose-6-phosphate dehydrogenase